MGKNSEISISIYYILKSCPIGRPGSAGVLHQVEELLSYGPEKMVLIDEGIDHDKTQTYLRCSRFIETPEGYFVKIQKLGKSSFLSSDKGIKKGIIFFQKKQDFEDLLEVSDHEYVCNELKKKVLMFLNKKTHKLEVGEAYVDFFEKIKVPKLGDKNFEIEESIQ